MGLDDRTGGHNQPRKTRVKRSRPRADEWFDGQPSRINPVCLSRHWGRPLGARTVFMEETLNFESSTRLFSSLCLSLALLGFVGTTTAACDRITPAGNDESTTKMENPGASESEHHPFGRSIWEGDDGKKDAEVRSETADSGRRKESLEKPKDQLSVPARAGAGLPVLCYHHLFEGKGTMGGFNMEPSEFERQIALLKERGYRSVPLDDFRAAAAGRRVPNFPERPVLLTFDDGSLSHHTVAWPILKKYGFTGVLFLYPSIIMVGKPNYMRWNHVRELVKSGVFEAASHTFYHPMLPTMNRTELRSQLVKSKTILEKELGIVVKDLAYPFGLYDERVIQEAKAAGYLAAYTVNLGSNHPGADPFTLSRYMVAAGTGDKSFVGNLEIESPRELKLEPADGSFVKAGQKLALTLPGVDAKSVTAKIGGREVTLKADGSGFSGIIPATNGGRGFLSVVVRAKSSDNRALYRQFLFLDANRYGENGKLP